MRSALVVSVLVAACSSKAKQSEPAPKTEPTPAAPSGAAPVAGSSADPWSAQGSSVSQDELLAADMDVICGAAKATGKAWFNEVGPYIAENMKSTYKYELFEGVTTGTASLDDIVARIRKLMAKTGVTKCDTVDVLLEARRKSK
jgi:hypothetical protein